MRSCTLGLDVPPRGRHGGVTRCDGRTETNTELKGSNFGPRRLGPSALTYLSPVPFRIPQHRECFLVVPTLCCCFVFVGNRMNVPRHPSIPLLGGLVTLAPHILGCRRRLRRRSFGTPRLSLPLLYSQLRSSFPLFYHSPPSLPPLPTVLPLPFSQERRPKRPSQNLRPEEKQKRTFLQSIPLDCRCNSPDTTLSGLLPSRDLIDQRLLVTSCNITPNKSNQTYRYETRAPN